jgi:hypothetical protein
MTGGLKQSGWSKIVQMIALCETILIGDVLWGAVSIPDTGLRGALEAALGKELGAPIEANEMAGLTILQAGGRGIANLEGLQHATRLETLILRSNALTSLSPLSNLSELARLEIDDNALTGLAEISGLIQLRYLFAHNNSIADLTGIENLTALEDLILFNNSIEDVAPITGLTALKRLNLSRNLIHSITGLQSLQSLEVLLISENALTDIHALRTLNQLRELDISSNRIISLGPLGDKPALTDLDARSNYLSSMEDWPEQTNLPAGAVLQIEPQLEMETFASWAANWGLDGTEALAETVIGTTGQANILLYSMGLPPYFDPESIPQVSPAAPDGLRLRYRRHISAGGILRTIEASDNLESWTAANVERIEVLAEPVPGQQIVEAWISKDANRTFLRLRAEAIP